MGPRMEASLPAAAHAARAGQSANERLFILRALNSLAVTSPEDAGASSSSDGGAEGPRQAPALRADGRQPLDLRAIRITFGRRHAHAFAEVQLGRTRVRAAVSSTDGTCAAGGAVFVAHEDRGH